MCHYDIYAQDHYTGHRLYDEVEGKLNFTTSMSYDAVRKSLGAVLSDRRGENVFKYLIEQLELYSRMIW